MIETDLTIIKSPIEDPEQRFLDFRISPKKTGPGMRLSAKWPAMEAFVLAQMEKDYGEGLSGGITPSKVIKGGSLYTWSGRAPICPGWGGPPISQREKDPLWSGDGTYFNIWWCFAVGLKDGIHWDMRFPPDADHMEGYAKHLSAFAREFGERTIRPYEISLAVSLRVVK